MLHRSGFRNDNRNIWGGMGCFDRSLKELEEEKNGRKSSCAFEITINWQKVSILLMWPGPRTPKKAAME